MTEFFKLLIGGIMDALEEFFDAMIIPTQRYTLYSFFISLVFLGGSVAAEIFQIETFVNWQEATTCSILLLIVVLIDSSTRSKIKGNVSKLKTVASTFVYQENEEGEPDEEGELNE